MIKPPTVSNNRPGICLEAGMRVSLCVPKLLQDAGISPTAEAVLHHIETLMALLPGAVRRIIEQVNRGQIETENPLTWNLLADEPQGGRYWIAEEEDGTSYLVCRLLNVTNENRWELRIIENRENNLDGEVHREAFPTLAKALFAAQCWSDIAIVPEPTDEERERILAEIERNYIWDTETKKYRLSDNRGVSGNKFPDTRETSFPTVADSRTEQKERVTENA